MLDVQYLACVILYALQDLNDEAVLETVDFSEFEAMFQVKRFEKKQTKREESKHPHIHTQTNEFHTTYLPSHAALQKLSEELHLIENRRARNLGEINIYYIICLTTVTMYPL